MYQRTKELKGVSGIKSFKNEAYYTIEGVLMVNDNSIIDDVEGNSFWFIDGGIYFFNEEGERRFKKGDVNHLLKFPLFTEAELNGEILCKSNFRRENRKWKWELGVFNLESLNVVRELPFENYTVELVVDYLGIGHSAKNELSAIDTKEDQIKWELKLDQFGEGELKEILGVYQAQLLVACSDHLLLSVDVNTGEILHKWQELPGFEEGQYKGLLPEPADFVLDKEAGKLIGVFSKYYFEIDLESGEISYEDIRQELNTHHINSFRRIGNNPFTKDHLFVTAHAELVERPNVDLDCVLALNRNTKKVDWVHIFKDTGLGTNVPQITSNHLYQLDTERNLYVFERIS